MGVDSLLHDLAHLYLCMRDYIAQFAVVNELNDR